MAVFLRTLKYYKGIFFLLVTDLVSSIKQFIAESIYL
jgi:hypothetical protein